MPKKPANAALAKPGTDGQARDHTLSPAMEKAGAKKAGGVAISIPTCRVAMLQEPQKVADLIMEAAKGAAQAEANHASR